MRKTNKQLNFKPNVVLQERLTNALQSQLIELRRERTALLQREEEEGEMIANRLNMRIGDLEKRLETVIEERDSLAAAAGGSSANS